jgi:hypothetical protein
MNTKVHLSKKTKSYLLRVVLTAVVSLVVGVASTGQMLQVSAEGLAQSGPGSPLVGDVRIAPDLKPVSVQQLAAAPSNDSILTPTIITLTNDQFNDLALDTTNATSDTDINDPTSIVFGDCDSDKGVASVWYKYTPGADINLYVDTIDSNYDTVLAVWEGSPGYLTLVSCNDDISLNNLQSKVGFYAQYGNTYYIEVIEFAQPAPQALAGVTRTLNFHVEKGNFSTTDVYIGLEMKGSYTIPSGGQVSPRYPAAFAGPVQVVSTNEQNIMVSERQIYGSSFTETLGVPDGQLTTDYWFPWYDGLTMNTWISIGAPDTNSADAEVDVYIGGTKMNPSPYVIPAGGQMSPKFSGTFAGPVEVVSTNGQDLIVSERQIFGSSFTETLGMPGNQLTTDYWFPWYDGLTMNTWISIGAPDTNSTDAEVDIYIGGVKMNPSAYVIPAGGQMSPKFSGTFAGPVEVVSTNGQDLIVSERQVFGSSFTETLGVPDNQLTTDYWFPWYDGLTMNTWISIGAP